MPRSSRRARLAASCGLLWGQGRAAGAGAAREDCEEQGSTAAALSRVCPWRDVRPGQRRLVPVRGDCQRSGGASAPPRAVTPTLLQRVRSRQPVYFVWELTWAREPPPSLCGRFSVGFRPASEERLSVSLKPYTYDFQVENFFVCVVLCFGGAGGGVGKGSFLFFVIRKNPADDTSPDSEAAARGESFARGALNPWLAALGPGPFRVTRGSSRAPAGAPRKCYGHSRLFKIPKSLRFEPFTVPPAHF